MRNQFKKCLKAQIIIPLFLLAGILYALMLIITIPQVMSFSGGMKILDMMPSGYDADYVNTLLNRLGEQGRHAYLFTQIPVDMVYPLLFGISLSLILASILKKIGKFEHRLFYLCLLPLFAAFFDYCENIGIVTILNHYPDNHDILTHITNVFSILKSSFTTFSFIILIILLIVLPVKAYELKRTHRKETE